MQRKRIAVFANGWGNECLQEVGHGIRQAAALADMDVFAFLNYSVHTETEEIQKREFNIFKLPNLEDYDAAVVFGNSFNSHLETEYIQEELPKSGIPSICLEYRMDGIDYLGSDDYSGMYNLAKHMMVDHGVRDIMFMGGIREHPGNQIRMKAVLDVAKECGITIPEDNFLYGDFSGIRSVEVLEEWCLSHEKLPEAIICANDHMAVGICDWVKEHGFRIPEDIKITGFDCIKAGQEYEPAITSVNREWVTLGNRCMEKIMQKMRGEEVSSEEELGTKLVCGGSCGCKVDEMTNSKKMLRRRNAEKKVDGFYCDQHFRHMYLSIRHDDTPERLNRSLSLFFQSENWLEGNKVMVALYPEFFHMSELSTERLKMNGYPEQMEMVCSMNNGNALGYCRMNTREAVFQAANESQVPGTYVFVPIRNDDINFGFAMLSRGFSIVQNDILYIWTRHMNQYMEQVRSNITIRMLTKRLETLSVTDKLTDVYNRTGCESIIYEKLENCQLDGGRSIVMIADVDGLKHINDTFGHASGDLVIKLAVETLKEVLTDNFMIGRFGGDEFLLGCVSFEEMDLESLALSIMKRYAEKADMKELPFKLSMSVGGIQLAKGDAFHIEECIQKADQIMYQIKKLHHDQMK